MQIVADNGAVLKQGYLRKKIWRFARNTNYFVLRDNGKFYYYKSRESAKDIAKHKGFISIKDIYVLPRGLKTFVVYTKKNVWYLKAKTSEDRDDWIEKLKSARASMQMKDDEEMKRIMSNSSTKREKLNSSELFCELNRNVQILCTNMRTLEVKLDDFRQSLPSNRKLSRSQVADLEDMSCGVTANIQSTLNAAEGYLAQSKCLEDEMKRMMHDLRFESDQRSNLLRQIEVQAKQLKCIEKGFIRAKSNKAEEELSNLDDYILASDFSESEKDLSGWQDESETGKDHSEQNIPTTAPSTNKQQLVGLINLSKIEKRERSRKSVTSSSVELPKVEISETNQKQKPPPRKRRTMIPYRKKSELSLWSLLKNALGKELSKIPLPVDFNEPLSFIQRLTECLEYAELIDKAAKVTNPTEQMIFVATFVISTLCNTSFRTCKPFNPLWSETFEFDRTEDLGWRAIAEQVSHHPPISAIHAEGNGWIFDEDMCVRSNFQATAMKLYPEGMASLFFPATKSFYHWTMKDIKTIVKGFIIGPITIHNEGKCTIANQPHGINCELTLTRHSFFSADNKRSFSGKICNKYGTELCSLSGDWSERCFVTRETYKEAELVWKRKAPPKESEFMYNYTAFAIELNEPEEAVAPTDSRLRPDMRMMEDGNWDSANRLKERLEQKQRTDIKIYQDRLESGQKVIQRPVWFKKCFDRRSGSLRYIYQNQYWKCKKRKDWSRCPDIFGTET